MAKWQTTSNSFHAVTGALLFSFGLAWLTANLKELATQASTSFSSQSSSLGAAVELVLAALRAVHTYFFDQATFQAGLHSILVSFWPVILVIIGATLLQYAIAYRFASPKSGRTFSSGEYESES